MSKGKQTDKRSPLLRGWETFGDIFVINIMFLLCSLPIVTIGASLCALYAMSMKLVNREEGAIARGFITEFKRNFKQGTIAWIVVAFAFVAVYGELFYVINFDGPITKMYTVLVVIEIVALAMVLPFLFPLISRYENTLWNTVKNSFLLSISNLGKWLKIFLAWFAPIVLCVAEPKVFFTVWYLWLIIAFGLIGYGTSHTLLKVFERVGDVKEEKTERAEREKEKEKEKYNTHGAIRKRAMFATEAVEDSEQEPENVEESEE